MKLFFRALLKSVWLFLAWLLIRIWQLRFEVSPLPDWTLSVFVYLLLLLAAFFFAYRLLRHEELHTRQVAIAMSVLLIGGVIWEGGLLVWSPGGSWAALQGLWSVSTLIALIVEAVGIAIATSFLHHRQTVMANLLAEQIPVE